MLYILFGKDDFSCEEYLAALKARHLSNPALGDLNFTVLDGASLTLTELRHHCDALPFLGERRLVLVEGLLGRWAGASESAGKGALPMKDALDYFAVLPPTTDLVLYDAGLDPKERDKSGRSPGEILGGLFRWARRQGDAVLLREFPAKRGGELAQWLDARARSLGVQVDASGRQALLAGVGGELRVLAGELEKLALYVGPGGTISEAHVRALVSQTREANVFAIVDAIGEGKWQRAIAEMRRLMDEGSHPLYIMTMIERQFRLIAQARALSEELGNWGNVERELARRLKLHEYVAGKVTAQARRYSLPTLQNIYGMMVETDAEIKTGRKEMALALEHLVLKLAEEAGGRKPASEGAG